MRATLIRRLPPRSRSVNHRFADAVDTEPGFPLRVGQRDGAKRSQSQPRCCETKRLAQMPRFDQDATVDAREIVFPLRAAKDGGHQNDKCGAAKPLLVAEISS